MKLRDLGGCLLILGGTAIVIGMALLYGEELIYAAAMYWPSPAGTAVQSSFSADSSTAQATAISRSTATATAQLTGTYTAIAIVTPTIAPIATTTQNEAPSPVSGLIAYHLQRPHPLQIYLIAPDGSARSWLPNQPDHAAVPNFSPDGRAISFEAKAGERWEVFVMNVDGTGLRQLTTQGGYDAAWSPTGERLVFTSFRDGNSELYVINTDGAGERRLTTNNTYEDDAAWAPDGVHIVFEAARRSAEDIGLYILNVDTGQESIFKDTTAIESTPAWSHDGQWVAYELGKGDPYQLVVSPAPDTGDSTAQPLTDWGAVRWRPAWSPDDQWIAFTSDASGSEEIWVVSRDGRELRQVTRESGAVNATWGPRP